MKETEKETEKATFYFRKDDGFMSEYIAIKTDRPATRWIEFNEIINLEFWEQYLNRMNSEIIKI